jgi:hypothetical protein
MMRLRGDSGGFAHYNVRAFNPISRSHAAPGIFVPSFTVLRPAQLSKTVNCEVYENCIEWSWYPQRKRWLCNESRLRPRFHYEALPGVLAGSWNAIRVGSALAL